MRGTRHDEGINSTRGEILKKIRGQYGLNKKKELMRSRGITVRLEEMK